MRFPVIASTSAFRAWSFGVALAIALVWLPFAPVVPPLPMPFFAAYNLIPLSFAVLALYALAVRPQAFAASGALLGVAPFFAWGVIDGLERCARFNRGGPRGGCEADPTSQLILPRDGRRPSRPRAFRSRRPRASPVAGLPRSAT